MSYDVSLEYGPVGEDAVQAWSGYCFSNIAPVWDAALGHSLRELDGRWPAVEVRDELWAAANLIRHDVSVDSVEAWSSSRAARFLEDIAVACGRWPDARIRVCS